MATKDKLGDVFGACVSEQKGTCNRVTAELVSIPPGTLTWRMNISTFNL